MNKKIVSALLCGAMILGSAVPAMAGSADGKKSHWLVNPLVTHSSKSLQNPS